MYYEEKWIDGYLCWKSERIAPWVEFTKQQYTDRCLKLERYLKEFRLDIDALEEENRLLKSPASPSTQYKSKEEPSDAIEFLEWVTSEGYQPYDGCDRWILLKNNNVLYPTKELYTQFKSSK